MPFVLFCLESPTQQILRLGFHDEIIRYLLTLSKQIIWIRCMFQYRYIYFQAGNIMLTKTMKMKIKIENFIKPTDLK